VPRHNKGAYQCKLKAWLYKNDLSWKCCAISKSVSMECSDSAALRQQRAVQRSICENGSLERNRTEINFIAFTKEVVYLCRCLGLSVCLQDYYDPDHKEGGNKRCFCLSVCLSVAYIANNSRSQRPSVPKFGRKVPHRRRDSHTSFRVKRSKVKVGGGRVHTVSA